MANSSLDSEKALKIARKIESIDCEEISKIFKKIINKGIKTDLLDMRIPRNDSKKVINMKINDFIDQFVYYRNLRGYTLKEVGQVIGVSEKYYNKYERRVHKLTDKDKIYKIAKFLKIEEKLLIPEEDEECKIDKKELKKYLVDNKITNSELSRLTGISRRSIVDWFNTKTEISNESGKKIKTFILKFEENKKNSRVG